MVLQASVPHGNPSGSGYNLISVDLEEERSGTDVVGQKLRDDRGLESTQIRGT